MKKLAYAVGLVADLAVGSLLVISGLAVMLGGATGTLWLR